MKRDLTAIVQAELNQVAVLQYAAVDPLAIHKNAQPVTAVLKPVSPVCVHNGRAATRNTPVVELQVVARLSASANQEGRLRYRNGLGRTAGVGYFQRRLGLMGKVGHRHQGVREF